MSFQSTKILIADTSVFFREGIKSILEEFDTLQPAEEVSEAKKLFSVIESDSPDLLIIVHRSSDFCCSTADIKKILVDYNSLEVLLIAADAKQSEMQYLIESGVKRYIFEDCEKSEFIDAVHAAVNGDVFFCRKLLKSISNNSTENESCIGVKLSNRELEVVSLIAAGFTNKEIAKKLFISVHTVSTHRKNVLRKLGLRNSSELVFYVISTGMISMR